jgi:hypothetical protein
MPDAALDSEAAAATAGQAREVAQVAAGALAWFGDNPAKVKQEAIALGREFRKFGLAARKLEAATHRPMCVGVFGPSQAGKSYLISALARKGTARVRALFETRDLDFVADINPEGGQESTGLVTRFTIHPVATPAGMPVALRLLSQTDLVKIIGNTYFADFDRSEDELLKPETVHLRLAELGPRAAAKPVDNLTEDDVYDLQEYFERHFKGEPTVKTLGTAFWARAAQLAPLLDGPSRGRLFGLLWADIEPLTQLYVRLLEALRRLAFADMAFCPLDALVPRETRIIDVQTLSRPGEKPLAVAGQGGRSAALDRADIAALTAELTIVLKEKPWDFFEHTDLLDFPGARSRESIKDPKTYLAAPEKLPGLFLRGKVAYLFQRYCAEQELTAMLLCIGPSNQEVRTLPAMMKDWIDATHGATPQERARLAPALFLTLTKFDAEFEDKAGQAESSEARWTTRLNASLLDFFGKAHDWPHEWTPGEPFRNTFWLRNPNFRAKHMFDYDENGVELGLRESERPRIERWKQDYLKNAEVQKHFQNPERAWDEALRRNDGGISYLAEQLRPVCHPEIKRKQIETRVAELSRLMAERLRRYYVSGDMQAELVKRREQARTVSRSLAQCAADQTFGHLLKEMQVDYDLLAEIFYRVEVEPANGADGKEEKSGPAPVGKRVDPGALLSEVFFDEPASPAFELAESGPADQAERFADMALAEWMELLRKFTEDPDAASLFRMPGVARVNLVDELIEAAKRQDLKTAITARVRKATSFRQKLEEAVAKPVTIAQDIINGYVDYLGFDKAKLAERPTSGREKRPVFAPRPPVGDYPALGEEPAAYDQAFYVDWITGFVRLVEDNVRFRDGSSVDVVANARLGGLIEKLAAIRT